MNQQPFTHKIIEQITQNQNSQKDSKQSPQIKEIFRSFSNSEKTKVSRQNSVKLSKNWSHMIKFYEPLCILGEGSFGQVVKAKCLKTEQVVAIKRLKNIFRHDDLPKYVLRELSLLHQLSMMPDNIFTIKLLDVIIDAKTKEDLQTFDQIFLVTECIDHDLRAILTTNKPRNFDSQHAKSILYNLLCSINFLQTANILHRDLKPANILISKTCTIKICDFGMAITMQSKG